MSYIQDPTTRPPTAPGQRLREILVFVLLAFAIWPILSVAFVGAYGFLVWFYQMFAGPPGPPSAGH
ncbi:periplasmic nitrate reductase, NapE protein [Paracoccus ravus]|uniref:periplasmic nitrate reductase, NapE protein n=1 Tax=Paracoccus ravus TaxID=2447760 RepID=UPI001FD716DC|nr:periplasmic nitrate reductase, NapE protein [Paracoccus ravus]